MTVCPGYSLRPLPYLVPSGPGALVPRAVFSTSWLADSALSMASVLLYPFLERYSMTFRNVSADIRRRQIRKEDGIAVIIFEL